MQGVTVAQHPLIQHKLSRLRAIAKELPAASAMVAGELVAMARVEAEQRREEWPEAWMKANEGKMRTWLTP